MHFSSKKEADAFTETVKSIQNAFLESEDGNKIFDSLSQHFILDAFEELNEAGKTEAVKLLYKLSANPKYQRQPEEGEKSAVDPQEDN